MQYNSRGRSVGTPYPKKAKKPVVPTIPAGYEQLHKDLLAYNGTFHVVLSIRSALLKYGKLSDKQWAVVSKCLTSAPIVDPNTILADGCHVPITVSASAARYIAKTHNWPVNPRTLTVVQIKSYSRRKYKVKVKIDWDSNVSECRCCGKSLTDWRSQATGVGPTCVKRTNIQYVKHQSDVARFQQQIQQLVAQLGIVEVELKDWHIQFGSDALERIVKVAKPTPVQAPVATYTAQPIATVNPVSVPLVYLSDCIWNEQDRTLHFDLNKALKMCIDDNTEKIYIHNVVTGRTVLFAKLTQVHNIIRYASMSDDYGNNVDIQLVIK